MLLDHIDNPLVETILEREIYTFLDMRNNNQSAHGRSEIIMRIFVCDNVLGKIIRLHQLTNVVKIGTGAADSPVGSNLVSRSLSQVCYDIAMMPGPRSLKTEPQQQRMITVRH